MSEQDATMDDFVDQNDSNSSYSGERNADWPLEKLSDHIQLVSGAHVKSDKVHRNDDSTPYLTGPDDFEGLGFTVTKYTDEPTNYCEPGDTLVTVKGSGCGKSALSDQRACISRQLKALRPESSINPIYLYYTVSEKERFLETLSEGSAIPGLSNSHLTTLDIPVPELEEQRKIATVLHNVDQAIQKSEEIIEQTKRVQRGLIRERVTGRNPGVELKEAIVGTRRLTVPEHWSDVRLGEVANVVSGKSFPREYQRGHAGPRPVIKVEDMNLPGNEKYIKDVTNRVTDEVINELSKNIFPKNTVIHPRVGEALLLNKTRITFEDAAFDDNIMGWVTEGIHPEYLYYASTMVDFNAVAQTGTVPSINKEMVGNFRFPLPPEEEQEEIVEDLSRIDGQISIYEQEKKRLQRLKQGLIQDVLSGTVRMTDTDIDIVPQVAQHG